MDQAADEYVAAAARGPATEARYEKEWTRYLRFAEESGLPEDDTATAWRFLVMRYRGTALESLGPVGPQTLQGVWAALRHCWQGGELDAARGRDILRGIEREVRRARAVGAHQARQEGLDTAAQVVARGVRRAPPATAARIAALAVAQQRREHASPEDWRGWFTIHSLIAGAARVCEVLDASVDMLEEADNGEWRLCIRQRRKVGRRSQEPADGWYIRASPGCPPWLNPHAVVTQWQAMRITEGESGRNLVGRTTRQRALNAEDFNRWLAGLQHGHDAGPAGRITSHSFRVGQVSHEVMRTGSAASAAHRTGHSMTGRTVETYVRSCRTARAPTRASLVTFWSDVWNAYREVSRSGIPEESGHVDP